MHWVAGTRFAGMILLSWLAAVAVVFVLIRMVPGDPVEIFIRHTNLRASDELVAAYRQNWGLDQGLFMQFLLWLKGFVTLDWGASFATGRGVSAELLPRIWWSAAIGMGGILGALICGWFLGFRAALFPGGIADKMSR
ncbi:MAG: hypothetical protein AAGC96_10475, partial [Pseudomonadota bacterium]